MKINYNVIGAKRKELVGAISQELNAPTKYLGAPTFAYEVGGYRIDKTGVVEGEDNLDLEVALREKGFDAETRKYDGPDNYDSGSGGIGTLDECPDIDQHHPGQYANPDAPITEAMQKQLDEVPEPDRLVIESPLEGFTDKALENLDRLISSKAALIKKAIGTDALPVERTETTLKFPWFRFDATGDEAAAYTRFVGALCAAAKEQKRVNAKEKPVENEKFAFRVFLLRLGFVGDEYKAARKILLKNLSGNSAFKNGAPQKTEDGGSHV